MKNWWKYSRLRDTLYNIKYFCYNVWRYRKGLYHEIRPWDSHGAMWMFKEVIRDIKVTMQDGSHIQEVDETRIPKEKDIARVIELIEHKLSDDFAERCGYNFDYNIDFKPVDGKPGFVEMTTTEGKEAKEHNSQAIKTAIALEESEHEELMQLIGKYREWWI